eukprot:contig_9675_g2311
MPSVQGAFNNRDIMHYDSVSVGGKPPPPFDIHYRRHPKHFWRTIVYYYTGPDGDIPIRMAVAAVEYAIWELFHAHGMAAMNSMTPSVSAVPLVPIVGDTDEWRKLRAELVAYKEEHGDMCVTNRQARADWKRLANRVHHVRLQRGLGDPAEEQWLTGQGFEWDADRASRTERGLQARQWPVVKDVITWFENHNGDLPRRISQAAQDKIGGGVELAARKAEDRLRRRWTDTIRIYGGVSLDHAKLINAAFLRGRGKGITFRTGR